MSDEVFCGELDKISAQDAPPIAANDLDGFLAFGIPILPLFCRLSSRIFSDKAADDIAARQFIGNVSRYDGHMRYGRIAIHVDIILLSTPVLNSELSERR